MVLHGQGCSNKEIARAIGIAAGTVKCHVDAIRAKVGFCRRIELATWFAGYKPLHPQTSNPRQRASLSQRGLKVEAPPRSRLGNVINDTTQPESGHVPRLLHDETR
jgi:Bacterial regulatory proteins, luxR family